jgi:ubiquinone/menaquinone biosynthesis C-methylase UbiE
VDEPAEKAGLRTAWGRVAPVYEGMWAARTAPFSAAGLDLLDPPSGAEGLDVACGPGDTTVALAARLAPGRARGVDFSPAMVERARERFGGREDVSFGVDDAERLSLPDDSVDVLTCSFGLMYFYDARAAIRGAARVLRPGGRMLQVVWGPAPRVWFVPVIELIETRAAYFSAVCPMMFFYGLPGVLPRMIEEAGMEPGGVNSIPGRMRFADAAEAVEAAVLGGPLAGLFLNRLDDGAQAEVRRAMTAHVESLAERDGAGISLPAEVGAAVGTVPGGDRARP